MAQRHKWPKGGRAGRCERVPCQRLRVMDKGAWLYSTQKFSGLAEESRSPGPCAGTNKPKAEEKEGKHDWIWDVREQIHVCGKCPARATQKLGMWQRKPRAPWRSVADGQAIEPCRGTS